MSIEAMKQALEALENNRWTHYYCEDTWYSCPKHEEGCANDSEGDECNCGADKANAEIEAAIASLRQALSEAQLSVNENSHAIEQAEKQEPVAWIQSNHLGLVKRNHAFMCRLADHRLMDDFIPLYTTPQPQREWVGLTEDDVVEFEKWLDFKEEGSGWVPPQKIAAYIEAKLKDKNT